MKTKKLFYILCFLLFSVSAFATISSITLNSPVNSTVTTDTTPNFNFTPISTVDATMSCTLYVDFGNMGTNASTQNNTATILTATVSQGTHDWRIQCTDSNNTVSSETREITIDSFAPTATINSASFITSDTTPDVNFTIDDNVDANIDYTFYVDGASDVSGTARDNVATIATLSAMSQGTHSVLVQGTDDAGNAVNSSTISITVDATDPSITLVSPANTGAFSGRTTTLIWTVTDNMDSSMACDVSLDGSAVATNVVSANNTNVSTPLTLTSYGTHNWNVACRDNVPNTGNSVNFTFTNSQPRSGGDGGGGFYSPDEEETTEEIVAPATLVPGICSQGTYCAGNCCSGLESCYNGGCVLSTSINDVSKEEAQPRQRTPTRINIVETTTTSKSEGYSTPTGLAIFEDNPAVVTDSKKVRNLISGAVLLVILGVIGGIVHTIRVYKPKKRVNLKKRQ